MDLGEDDAPAVKLRALRDRLLQAFRMLSGQHPDRPARATRGEPAVLRVIAPLALLVMIATVICVGFGFMLARQSDNALEAERRQSLAVTLPQCRHQVGHSGGRPVREPTLKLIEDKHAAPLAAL